MTETVVLNLLVLAVSGLTSVLVGLVFRQLSAVAAPGLKDHLHLAPLFPRHPLDRDLELVVSDACQEEAEDEREHHRLRLTVAVAVASTRPIICSPAPASSWNPQTRRGGRATPGPTPQPSLPHPATAPKPQPAG